MWMTITYVQAFPPKWIIINNEGTVAGGAQLYTYDSLTRLPRATYSDPAGSEALPNPIIFDLNGTFGPIYWQIDTSDPDGYYIEVFDSSGNLLWNEDNFPQSSGGGSDVTVNVPLQNYITNNQFINHCPPTASPIGLANVIVAPSNHHGFTPAQTNPLIGTYGILSPDIVFTKNNTTATDSITFVDFALSDASFFAEGDNTPAFYVRYQSNMTTGETYKSFQFPITQKVKNLSNQPMTFSVWAKVTSTPVTINFYTRQYYGSGTAATAESSSTRVLQDSYVLTSSWVKYLTNFTMPSVSGNSIGTPGLQTDDDAVYLQLDMPLDTACDIQFIKPCLFLGTINPDIEFDSYDQIDGVSQTARTGDVKTSLYTNAPLGWLPMNDSTIGNTGSGATYAGDFTFQLYATLYTSVIDTWAPVSSGRTSPGNTIATAITDFLAGKTLKMPLSLGRALAGAGSGSGLTTRALGQNLGSETISISAMPSHSHSGLFITSGTGAAVPGTSQAFTTSPTVTGATGGSAADGNMQPTTFFNIFIKL